MEMEIQVILTLKIYKTLIGKPDLERVNVFVLFSILVGLAVVNTILGGCSSGLTVLLINRPELAFLPHS